MPHPDQFTLDFNPALPTELYRHLPFNERAVLLHQNDLGRPITSIETIAKATKPKIGFEHLHITTGLILDVPYVDVQQVGEEFKKQARLRNPNFRIGSSSSDQRRSGDVVVGDMELGDSVSNVFPVLGGEIWGVNTDLENFRYDANEDMEGIVKVLGHHVVAVSTLVTIISEAYGPEGGSKNPSYFYMSMPHKLKNANIATSLQPFDIDKEDKKGESHSPQDSFDKFAGIDSVVGDLRDVVKLANMPKASLDKIGVEPIQAVMLYGPSGVGKTELIQVLARALDAETEEVDFSDLGSKWTSEWGKNLDQVFERSYARPERVLIVLDEMDGLVNSGNEGSTGNITAVLKKQLEKLKKYPNVFVAAATNNIDAIDPVILSDKRIPLKIPIPLPTHEQRVAVFSKLLGEPELKTADLDALETEDIMGALKASESTGINCDELAELTDNFSGGDIRELIAQVNRRRVLDNPDADIALPPTQTELMQAIDRARKARPQ